MYKCSSVFLETYLQSKFAAEGLLGWKRHVYSGSLLLFILLLRSADHSLGVSGEMEAVRHAHSSLLPLPTQHCSSHPVTLLGAVWHWGWCKDWVHEVNANIWTFYVKDKHLWDIFGEGLFPMNQLSMNIGEQLCVVFFDIIIVLSWWPFSRVFNW